MIKDKIFQFLQNLLNRFAPLSKEKKAVSASILKISREKIFSFTGFLLIIAILFTLNLLGYYLFLRYDLTSERIYSLSPISRKAVSSLDDPLIFKAYFSSNLPPPYETYREYLQHLLEEYRVYSRGKVKISFLDPAENEERKSEVQFLGIPPLRFTQIQSDKYAIQEGYMGLALVYTDKREVIPVIQGTEGLEYDITSRILKLASDQEYKIAFSTGHKELDPEENEQIQRKIATTYSLSRVNLKEGKLADKGLNALVILGPQEEFSEDELKQIDQFLIAGKSVACFLSRLDVNLETFFSRSITTGLEKILAYYGVKVEEGLVMDYQCQRISIRSRQGFFVISNIIEFPPFLVATNFNKEMNIVKNLNEVAFSFASPLTLEGKSKGDVTITPLVYSSEKSWLKKSVFSLNPLQEYKPEDSDKKGPFALAATLSGKFKSYFADQLPQSEGFISEGNSAGRLVVVGCSQILAPKFPLSPENPDFFLNIVDWLIQDEDLIAVRSKGVSFRPLRETSTANRLAIKYIDIFFPPFFFIFLGVACWRWRRRKLHFLREIYRGKQ